MSEKLWGGRFQKTTDEMVNDFQASIAFDKRMYLEDITGSIAHATMLAECDIISVEDRDKIIDGLKEILTQIEKGEFTFSTALEDIHMNIEQRLTEKIGEAGKRLHTARSRNDQVALDTHMYVRREIVAILKLLLALEETIVKKARENFGVIMPGYTHLQRAQPILFSHWLMAYFAMLRRDIKRFFAVYQTADIMPLGAGALAGTTFPIDRRSVQKQLGFDDIYTNSLDAVSDRDYILEFLSASSILAAHLSRLSEEIILWASREFSFIELDDAHCTGSSMMPQKKNPDVNELVRGKAGRIFGHLMAMLTTVKGLPLAYNKDLQEDKEGLFDTIDTVKFALAVYAPLIRDMKINKETMKRAVDEDFSNATDLADYLVKKGLPFREAHAVSGKAVHLCIEQGKYLADMTLNELKRLSPLFEKDIMVTLTPANCVNNRRSLGGTSGDEVQKQITAADEVIAATKSKIATLTDIVQDRL